jgi:glycosyltransferase involved in cell wall biosynthesis
MVSRFAVALGGKSVPGVKRVRFPARLAHLMWQRFGAPSVTLLSGSTDVVHGTNFVLPASGSVPGVVTIHDLSYLREGAFPGAPRLKNLVAWSAKRAKCIVVPTRAVADEVADEYPGSADCIVITPEGVSSVFFGATPLSDSALDTFGIRRPYVLATGTDAPRKNVARLLDAWNRAGDTVGEWMLVLAGPRGWGPRLSPNKNVRTLGWVGDETLPGMMAAADLFCFPSSYEGFGLPPLEAMAAGTPVLAGSYPCAREVLGDAADVVDPLDERALTEALVRLIEDPDRRRRLQIKGRAQAVQYTWDRTASATREAYKAALA